MDLKNCIRCKKIFSNIKGSSMCLECKIAEETEFSSVREYLRENRKSNIKVVSEETGVTVKKIIKYIKDGRIEATDGIQDLFQCEKCKVPIKIGQYCKDCKEKLNKQIQGVLKESDNSLEPKMRMHTRRN